MSDSEIAKRHEVSVLPQTPLEKLFVKSFLRIFKSFAEKAKNFLKKVPLQPSKTLPERETIKIPKNFT